MTAQAKDLWRFFNLVEEQPNGCWLWLGWRNPKGYGYFTIGGKSRLAHGWIMEVIHGPCPKDLQHDHLCHFPGCVNPAHLERVTGAENMRRRYARMLRCKNGHLWTLENTSQRKYQRVCLPCNRVNQKRYQEKLKLRKAS